MGTRSHDKLRVVLDPRLLIALYEVGDLVSSVWQR